LTWIPSNVSGDIIRTRDVLNLFVAREEKISQGGIEQLPSLLPRLWRLAVSLSGRPDLADDLVQSTCQRAIEKIEQFVPGSRFDSWVFTIIVSLWKNDRRAEAVRLGSGHVDASDIADLVHEDDPERNVYHRQVVAEVGRLPQAQRETVFLVYVEGFTYAEAAAILKIPIGTVMSRLASARRVPLLSGLVTTKTRVTG
jgi:RNA polymerase sigma-70 factor, ECF subfamily